MGQPCLGGWLRADFAGKDATTLRIHRAAHDGSLPCATQRKCAATAPIWSALLLAFATYVPSARAAVEPPVADTQTPIVVSAERSQRLQEGQYAVWVLQGRCEIRQGDVVARSQDAVLWIDAAQEAASSPSRIIAYLEHDVMIDWGRTGPPHRTSGKQAQTVSGRSWLGRFHTTAGIDVRVPEGSPLTSGSQMVQRGKEALNWTASAAVQPAQFITPLPTVAPQTPVASARNVSVRSRSNVPMQWKSFPSNNPQETIITISSGVRIVVSGIENVPGLDSNVVIIEADRVVIWTTALAGLSLSGEAFEQAGGRTEFYMEGNIIFREGDRVVYADRMYYNVEQNQGTILNAEMLTPVPEYDGLVRLKADVLQQIDRQNFVAYGGALTSSRLGVPSYWFQSESVAFQDIQRTACRSAHGPDGGRPGDRRTGRRA